MTVVTANMLMEGLSGAFGNTLVFKTMRGKTFVNAKARKPDKKKGTIAQRSTRVTFRQAKDIYGLCIKVGYVKKISPRFSVDFFAGLGARFVNTKLTNIEGRQITYEQSEWIQTSDFRGLKKQVHFEAGAKINCILLNKLH